MRQILRALCLAVLLAGCTTPTLTSSGQRAIATPVPAPELPDSNVTAEQLNASFDALLRPTNDLTESVRAVVDFPEVAGTEGARVVSAQLTVGKESISAEAPTQVVTVVYETSQDHRSTLDFNWTALGEYGIPRLQPGVRDNSSGAVAVAPTEGRFTQISAEVFTRQTGRTAVALTVVGGDVTDAELARFADWHDGGLPLSPDSDLAFVQLIAERNEDGIVTSSYRSAWEPFGTADEMAEQLVAAFQDQGWQYDSDGDEWTSTDPVEAQIVIDDLFVFAREY